jgi:integrase/recombinase XerD
METSIAISAFLKSRQAKGLSKRTITWYRIILTKFSEMFPDLPDNPSAIDDFLSSCRGGDERRHGYFRTIRAFYRFLYRRFKIINVIDLVETPKRRKKQPKPITLDQLDQLLSFPHNLRAMAAILFLADSGARIGELANLTKDDIFVCEWGPLARINGKTGERTIPISESTYQILLKVLPFNVKVDQLTRIVSWAFRDAHVKGSAHNLRHTFGTYWGGKDILMLKRIMGHSNISTTEIYRGLQFKDMCEQQHKFSPLRAVQTNRQMGLFLK